MIIDQQSVSNMLNDFYINVTWLVYLMLLKSETAEHHSNYPSTVFIKNNVEAVGKAIFDVA